MWPWGHLAVGYLLYTVFVHLWWRRSPDGSATIALAFATQFPDLVDKPLAWMLGVLPNGRSLAHSLLIAAVVIGVLSIVFRRYGRGREATAFGVGYLSHLAADALRPALEGNYAALGFLAWPVLPPVEYSTPPTFAEYLHTVSFTPFMAFEMVLSLLVFVLWLYDGAPGIWLVTSIPRWIGLRLPVSW